MGPLGRLFWFWPLPEPIFGFEALKGLGVPTFRPMEPVDEKFWVWPLPELIFGFEALKGFGVTTF